MRRIQRIILLFLIICNVLYENVNATSATTIALLKIISAFSLDRLSAFPIFTFLNAVTAFLKTLSHWTNLPCLYLPSNPIHVFLFVFKMLLCFLAGTIPFIVSSYALSTTMHTYAASLLVVRISLEARLRFMPFYFHLL